MKTGIIKKMANLNSLRCLSMIVFIILILMINTSSASDGNLRYFEFGISPYSSSENFIAATSESAVISLIEEQLALSEEKRNLHIHGAIASGNGGHNKNWSWHFVPDEWNLAEMSIELCDGISSHVEADLSYWLNTVKSFCSWRSRVLKEVELPSAGDIDGNGIIDLNDALSVLKFLVNTKDIIVNLKADVNQDSRIGIEEVMYIFRLIVGAVLPISADEKVALESTANSGAAVLTDITENIESLEQISSLLNYMGLNKIQPNQRESFSIQEIISVLMSNFPCGSISNESFTLTFTFNGDSGCGGITGSVKVTPSLSDGKLSYSIVYENVKKEDCTINGAATVNFSVEDGLINATHTFDNTEICGQNLNGTVIITYDIAGQMLSITGNAQNTYTVNETETAIDLNYSYNQADGITGTATVNKQTYFQFSDIKIDHACGVPISGSLTVNGTELDFSNTSCDNPEADVTVKGITFTLSLEDAKNLFANNQTRIGPSPRHASLNTVDSCEALINDLKQNAIKEMEQKLDENLKYALQSGGCRWYPVYYDYAAWGNGNPIPAADIKDDSSESSSATEYSETNNQVVGVDEADFVKNDGTYIYILADGKFQIVKAWRPEESKIISSFKIEGEPKKMFIHNQRAFIYSSLDYIKEQNYGYYPYYNNDNECTYGYDCEFTGDGRKLKITVLDISNIEEAKLLRETYFSGSYLNSRRIGDAVHSVVVFPDPEIEGLEYYPEELQCGGYYYWWYNYEYPTYSGEEIIAMFDALREKNREIILSSDTTDWLPSVKDVRYNDGQAKTEEKILGNCDEYYVSLQDDGKNFLSILSTSIAGTEPLNSTIVIGRPGAVYASSSAVYIASRHQQYGGIYWFFDSAENIEEASTVHKFTLNNEGASSGYAGSGVVKGRVLNQFSMDEHEGFFRIATTTGHVPDPNVHSTISVFKENGGELVLVGQTDNIAPTEDIRSARFDGDRGYIVTFKKTDPLFVFNLADPYKPAVAGELKIPGFSTYMHRMDDNHLLTIGYDAEDYGEYALFQGIMLQIFDISDMNNPSLVYKEVIGTRGSSSEAATNHLAFNFFKPKEMLAIPAG